MVLDNLTNDVRGTSAGAVAVVVCQLEPMQVTDVTPFNELLHEYLLAQGEGRYGCRTQIRLDYLKSDGYHVLPNYDSIIDRTLCLCFVGGPGPMPHPS